MENLSEGLLQGDYTITLPEGRAHELEQDQEYCIIKDKRGTRTHKIRFHDYGKIYSIPGLYERLFYEKLKCNSPSTVCGYLKEAIEAKGSEPGNLRVLDLGAGNGMVGEGLRDMGVEKVCGIDIEENAKMAVERDRQDVYSNYYVKDLTRLSDALRKELRAKAFNCMTSVAALGFGDIPIKVFAEGFNCLSTPAWVAFNIKEDFLEDSDATGFSHLMRRMMDSGIITIDIQERYRHRLSAQGTPIFYIALVGKKNADIPDDWVG